MRGNSVDRLLHPRLQASASEAVKTAHLSRSHWAQSVDPCQQSAGCWPAPGRVN